MSSDSINKIVNIKEFKKKKSEKREKEIEKKIIKAMIEHAKKLKW